MHDATVVVGNPVVVDFSCREDLKLGMERLRDTVKVDTNKLVTVWAGLLVNPANSVTDFVYDHMFLQWSVLIVNFIRGLDNVVDDHWGEGWG